MSYRALDTAAAAGTPESGACLLPRNGSVLVVSTCRDAQIRIGGSTAASRHTRSLPPGTTLLVSAGSRPIALRGRGFQLQPVDSGLSRLLAFHDHAMDLQRPVPDDRRMPVTLSTTADLCDPVSARAWLTDQLLLKQPLFELAASAWALREPYQLVRFVLENPDLGVQQLADRYGLSVAQFRRLGRKAFDRSLKEQLRLLRVGRVLHRYADTGHTFTRLSSDFGFSSPSHFCSEIKSLLGRSPSSIFQDAHLP